MKLPARPGLCGVSAGGSRGAQGPRRGLSGATSVAFSRAWKRNWVPVLQQTKLHTVTDPFPMKTKQRFHSHNDGKLLNAAFENSSPSKIFKLNDGVTLAVARLRSCICNV